MNSNKDCNEPECQECLRKNNLPYINHKKVRNKRKETSYKEALYNAKDDIRYLETGIQEALDIIRDWKNNGNDKENVIETIKKKLLELHVRKYR